MSPKDDFCSINDKVMLKNFERRICAGIIGAYLPGILRYCPREFIDRENRETFET